MSTQGPAHTKQALYVPLNYIPTPVNSFYMFIGKMFKTKSENMTPISKVLTRKSHFIYKLSIFRYI